MMGMQHLLKLCGPKMTVNLNPASVHTALVIEETAGAKCVYDAVENF